ncbi:hypothetical protein G6011_01098 [Alternaria panax]|uniref:Protein kinase domain-containing protein n=1 Tax=Alternaria panax TaxID=48097 RepID=A0AAD4IK12_9PLEO|nr:hypothetical protein G6011_01098 [Alternaria panax]
MGRADNKSASPSIRDVYFPGSRVGVHQFSLVPVWESNSWRLQSATETIAEVNDAPIQLSTPRTQKLLNQLPQAVHLRQNLVNLVLINGLRVEIFMLKTVRELYPAQNYQLLELPPNLQEVAHRPEAWAQDRYLQRSEQVSGNTYRVLERFTGKIETAKFFRHVENGPEFRDTEFLKFAKAKVDASLVRYLQSIEISHISAVITETHEGFESFAALEENIKGKHPRVRFTIASRLLRRLCSALAFLHSHKVIHGNLTKESVLLRLVDFRPEAVLLVDYSESTTFPFDTPEPFKRMNDDGRAAMEVVESCCDIWQLRKAATKDAYSEEFMMTKTEAARKEFELMERVVADFFGPKGMSRKSKKGKKMLRLLNMKQYNWHKARNEQIHNATRREVGPCRSDMIKEMELDWARMHPSSKIGQEQHMILTLGHPYLDDLVSILFHNRWELTPRDVCNEIRKLAGDEEEPWQTFPVKRAVSFTHDGTGFEERGVLNWLASCCEAYPEWHHAFIQECERHISPQHGIITFADVKRFRDALVEYGTMPDSMQATFARLTTEEIKDQPTTHIEETHQVWYHKPSRMFNLTQLHRLAAQDLLIACINGGTIGCNNFVEVRGESKIEGLYATLSLLATVSTQLDLIAEVSNHTPDFPLYDPADFSQVLYHVVLAHTGLLPWASVTRQGGQFNFHAPLSAKAPETAGAFLPTYFGSMKVFPTTLESREEYRRPDHWSKFKSAKEIDEAADVDKRMILPAKGPLKKAASKLTKSRRASSLQVDLAILAQTLEDRKQALAEVQSPEKRNDGDQSSAAVMPTAKRLHVIPSFENSAPDNAPSAQAPQLSASFVDRQLDHMIANMECQSHSHSPGSFPDVPSAPNESFYRRDHGVNANVLVSPPTLPAALKGSFTIAFNGDFNLEDDYRQAEDWLKVMGEKEESQVAGIFGLNFHHSLRQQGDGSDTEADNSDEEEMPVGGEKAKQVDHQTLSNLPTPWIKESSSFMLDPRAMTPMAGFGQQATSKSFLSRSSFQLATPRMSSPRFGPPPLSAPSFSSSGGARGHRRNGMSLSDLASVNLRIAPVHSSPLPQTTATTLSRTVTSPAAPDYSSPAWKLRPQRDEDEVPDTDQGEPFSDDSE